MLTIGFRISVVLSAAVIAIAMGGPLMPGNPHTVAPDEPAFWAIRGADRQFTATTSVSCAQNAVSALKNVQPKQTYNSSCGSPNWGLPCGSCQQDTDGGLGTQSNPVPAGTGQANDVIGACGGLQTGTCGIVNLGPPVVSGCMNPQNEMNNGVNPPVQYQCSNLIAIMNQAQLISPPSVP